MKLKTMLLFFPLTLVVSSMSLGQTQRTLRIGVVIDGKRTEEFRLMESMKEEILDLTRGEFDVRFPEDKRILCGWELHQIRSAIDRQLEDPDVDILLCMGVVSSHYLCHRETIPKPAIAPFVIDREIQGISFTDGASGVTNLCYMSWPHGLARDLEAFHEVAPFRNLVMMFRVT